MLFSFERGWMTVFAPMVIRFVPIREAFSAMQREAWRVVGGFGAGGARDCRLEDIARMLEL